MICDVIIDEATDIEENKVNSMLNFRIVVVSHGSESSLQSLFRVLAVSCFLVESGWEECPAGRVRSLSHEDVLLTCSDDKS